jgi:hypothetical protein
MMLPGSGTTLAYAEPVEQPVFPVRWALDGLVLFAAATIVERACIWWMILPMMLTRGGLDLGLGGVVDYVMPPVAAAALLWVVLRERRGAYPTITRSLVVLCAIQVLLAVLSIAWWSINVLPSVWTGRGSGGALGGVIWEAELVYLRLLPVAWPLMLVIFARRGLPTPRGAAAAFTLWAIATWACAAAATAALWHGRGRGMGAFSPDHYIYTITPAWTLMLIPVVAIGFMLWLGVIPARLRPFACAGAAIVWFAAALLRAWYDERMSSIRSRRFAELAEFGNLAGISAEMVSDLVLWQIAPVVLLLFLARPRPPRVKPLPRPRHLVH